MYRHVLPHNRAILTGLTALIFMVFSCKEIAHSFPEVKQVATSANLHTLAIQIQHAADENGGSITEAEAGRIVSQFNGGRDEWGNPIIFTSRREEGRLVFLLVSSGSDGRLDVADVAQYFTADRQEVTGTYSADLVNRNLERLRFAGK